MGVRSVLLTISVVLAYVLLRGWPEQWHPILRICMAVSVLVVSVAWWGRRAESRGHQAVAHRRPRWPDFGLMGLALLLVESLFLLFFAVVPEKAESMAVDFAIYLHPERGVKAKDEGWNIGSEREVVTGNTGIFNEQGERELPSRGEIQMARRPEVYLYPEDEQTGERLNQAGVYLRLATADRFLDQKWSSQIEAGRTYREEDGVIRLGEKQGAQVYGYRVYPVITGEEGRLLSSMPGTFEVGLSYLREVAPATYRLPPLVEGQKFYSYRVKSAPLNVRDLLTRKELLRLDLRGGDELDAGYLQLPRQSEETVSFLTEVVGSGERTLEALTRIEKYLNDHYSYSLELENPGNHPALENFLFHTKRGCCEHYATAATLLCRAANIPARLAYGWREGFYFSGQNFFLFRGQDAHAWTEVYLQGFGWVIFDTTPASNFRDREVDEDGALNVPPHPLEEVDDLEEESGGSLSEFVRWGVVVVLVCAVMILAFHCIRASQVPSEEREDEFMTRLPKPPRYLDSFRKSCAELGYPMPRGETLRQHLQVLDEEGMAPDFSSELLDYHYAVLYRERAREKKVEKDFMRRLKVWVEEKVERS